MKRIALLLLLLLFAIFGAIALKRYAVHRARASGQAVVEERNAYPADETLDPRNDDLERQVEQEIWNSPRALHNCGQAIARRLAQDQKEDQEQEQKERQFGDQARTTGLAVPGNLALSVQSERASIARIDKRLKALAHYNSWCPQCGTLPRATGVQ